MGFLEKIDVLICVGERDIDYLLEVCVRSCIKNFSPLGSILFVSNQKQKVKAKISSFKLDFDRIYFFSDNEILGEKLSCLDGWYRQQLIKLNSDSISKTKYVCVLGADTVILKNIEVGKLFFEGTPIIYYNRYSTPCYHLEYERKRILNLSKVLKVEPRKSFFLGDFIMDLMIYDRDFLSQLRNYIYRMYGENFPLKIFKKNITTLLDKTSFGEQTLYTMFLLDVLKVNYLIKDNRNEFVTQLHTQDEFQNYSYNSYVVHFVNKDFDNHIIKTNVCSKL